MTHARQSSVSWRGTVLAAIIILSFAAIFFVPRFGQDLAYHDFADKRRLLGIPNFFDVASNIPFLIAGWIGFRLCLERKLPFEWHVLFIGVALVAVGSGYYHWTPNNTTLVWDRLPMTVGFMGLFVALLSEHAGERLRVLLIPALTTGAASVFYWSVTDDLRFYAWVQIVPLLTVPLVLVIFPGRFTHRWMLLAALLLYVSAKLAESFDERIYRLLGSAISGHTIKHLLSAAGVFAIWLMLRNRLPAR